MSDQAVMARILIMVRFLGRQEALIRECWRLRARPGIRIDLREWLAQTRPIKRLYLRAVSGKRISIRDCQDADRPVLVVACSWCQQAKGVNGRWYRMDRPFVAQSHYGSHGICPDCLRAQKAKLIATFSEHAGPDGLDLPWPGVDADLERLEAQDGKCASKREEMSLVCDAARPSGN